MFSCRLVACITVCKRFSTIRRAMTDFETLRAEFLRAAQTAVREARADSLRRGISVFYSDAETGCYMMEQPDGRRFVIEFLPEMPREGNYRIVREVAPAQRAALDQIAS